MLIMENEEITKRNPFERIGKVFKYEFIHASKTLLPLYSVLLVLGLLIGLLASPMKDFTQNIFDATQEDFHYEFSYDSTNATREQQIAVGKTMAVAGLTFLYILLATAIFITTIIVLARRFRTSMLGDEAYLNLSLPVTMGEHLWGRFLSDLLWLLICFIVFTVSFMLCLLRNHTLPWFVRGFQQLNNIMEENNISLWVFYIQIALEYTISSALMILFVFCINSISSISQKNQTLIKIIAAVVLIIVFTKIDGGLMKMATQNEDVSFSTSMWLTIGINTLLCGICMGTTHIIFHRRLNLE
ncbi:MAG: hypothetical protein MJ188_06330 [Treponema sp.]|nr:hypothetical protein [Treponema sp.]